MFSALVSSQIHSFFKYIYMNIPRMYLNIQNIYLNIPSIRVNIFKQISEYSKHVSEYSKNIYEYSKVSSLYQLCYPNSGYRNYYSVNITSALGVDKMRFL